MGRRKRDRSWDTAELVGRLLVGLLLLGALSIGGITGFPKALASLASLALVLILGALAIAVLVLLWRKVARPWLASRSAQPSASTGRTSLNSQSLAPTHRTATADGQSTPVFDQPIPTWNAASVRAALDEIDWYQFEKFCAALLQADGFIVERKGGAHPDGGVDLVVEKDGARALIQCKHWRTWVVQEKTVREMLGSMTHFRVSQGAIYTLKGWTSPAAKFADEHAITLVDGKDLAASAAGQFTSEQLTALLRPGTHHCPKCEAPMVERTGAFGSFWGCSTYPRCRGKLKRADR